MQADKLLGVGDTHDYETWRRLLMAIEEVLATQPLEAACRNWPLPPCPSNLGYAPLLQPIFGCSRR